MEERLCRHSIFVCCHALPVNITPESQATGLTLLLIKYTTSFTFPVYFLLITFLLFQRNYL